MLRRAVFCRISVCISRANPISSLDAQPIEKINGLLFRQYLRGANLRFVKGTAKKGAAVPLIHTSTNKSPGLPKASLKCTRKDESSS